ncbi:Phosphoglucosamine mutase [Nymphon striatum]|nr:Phosphoglucosamine mutase [Nymphon striatum]
MASSCQIRFEASIERLLDEELTAKLAHPNEVGRATRVEGVHARYIEFAKRTLPRKMSLDGMRIVMDCANGAAYKVAPEALWELGADVVAIGDKPNGTNINEDCGSTSTAQLCRKVAETRADIGIALDGDADRLIVVDQNSNVIDGDQIMALVSEFWNKTNRLAGGGVVATVMSNLGLERFLNDQKLDLIRTQVGDRYVVQHMREHGFNLGGEQSGHMIMSDFATTGDGLVAALQVLAVVQAEDKPEQNHLLRVMAEGDDEVLIENVVNDIVAVVQKAAAKEVVMRSFKKLSLVAAALMASTAMVQAADLIPAPTHDLPPEVVPVDPIAGPTLNGIITGSELDSSFVLKGGIGYQVNDYFRVDATVAYHGDVDSSGSSRSIFSAAGPVQCNFAAIGELCNFSDQQELQTTVFLANAYVDLGTVNGFTPYLGGGVGAAKVNYGRLTNTQNCVTPGTCGVDGLTESHDNVSETRFAWAIHAGASYDINCKLKADVGYSYTRVERGGAFGYSDTQVGLGASGVQGFDQGIDIHSGTVGLRYALGDAGCHTPVEHPQVGITTQGVVSKTPSEGYTDVEYGSGWYLRGDITYNIDGRSNNSFRSVSDLDRTVQADYDDAVGARVGFGYYVAPNVRLEISAESILDSDFGSVRGINFSGQRDLDIIIDPVAGTTAPETVFFDSAGNVTGTTAGLFTGATTNAISGREVFDAEYSASSLIVNGYYDLAQVGQFKPYVGLGAGIGRINYSQTRTLTCSPGTGETCAGGLPGAVVETTSVLTDEYWTYAYQLSVGTAIAVDDRTSIDIGYSYTGFGEGDDLTYADGTGIDAEGVRIHQIRAGIRYDIW